MKAIFATIFLLLNFTFALSTTDSVSLKAKDAKGLILNGEGFWFMISEPEGWTVNIENAKNKKLNAYFTLDGYDYNNSPGLIYIRVLNKQDLTVDENLMADMQNTKKENNHIEFKSFNISKFKYKNASKTYRYLDNKTCDFLCYVDPGKEYKCYVIFVLTTDLKDSSKYMETYLTFLKSFTWGGDKIQEQK